MTQPESILIADIGSVKTKVGLVDQVGDVHRVIGTGASLTTVGALGKDALIGVRSAIEQIQQRANRRLLTDDGELITPESSDGQGVDAFVAVASAPPPLRIAIVGLSRDVSVAVASRAVKGTYAVVEATLALDQMGGRWVRAGSNGKTADPAAPPVKMQDPAVLAAEALAHANPDVIVLVGGIDGGATTALYEIANLVGAVVAARHQAARPDIIFAGNREARAAISARLGAVATLRVVDNIHPALDRENLLPLQREIESLYAERRIVQSPEYQALSQRLTVPLIPSARAFEHVVRFLSRRYALGILGIDLGGTATTLVTARAESFARVVRADLGLGRSAESVMAQASLERLWGWVPGEELTTEDIQARVLNRVIHPAMVPVTREDWHLCQALAREALFMAARDADLDISGTDLIVLSGGMFGRNPNQGGLVLLTLDALQPRTAMTMAVDSFGLLPAFGAVATVNPSAAADLIAQDGFAPLATVVVATSFFREGTVDVRVRMKSHGVGEMNAEIQHGSLELIPVAAGEKATLELRPAPGVNITGEGSRRRPLQVDIEGGALGLVVDARGRPIAFPTALDKRRAKTQEWLWDVGG